MDKNKQIKHLAALIVFILTIGISNQTIAQTNTYITQNTTWSTNQGGLGNIYIQNGATLTILSGVTITMDHNSHIFVASESKLNATGVTFETNAPLMWHGIYAMGLGSSFDQVYQFNPNQEKQPVIILTNCVLNRMSEGVQNALNGSSGGVIKIKGCVFNDCTIGVRFFEYLHYRQQNMLAKDLSYIRNCTFNHIPNMQNIPIALRKVMGIRIEGNTFNNSFEAIYSDHATFFVSDYYSGPIYNPTFVSSTVFNNCLYGIKAIGSNAQNGKSTIRDAEFYSNYRAIAATGVDNLEIYSNTISIQQFASNGKIVGIYLENCATFHVEDNDVSATGYNGAFPINTWGIVAHNCGANNNRFYRNTVSNCEYNIAGQEHNRGLQNQSGLQFICNNLSQTNSIGTDNTFYMAALTTQPNNPLHGINDWQCGGAIKANGTTEESSSAYNTIPQRALTSGDKYDFRNEHYRMGFDIHYKNPVNKYPLSQVLESNTANPTYDYYGDLIWVTDETSSYTNQCPSTVPSQYSTPTTLNDISAQLQAVHFPYGPLKSTFAGYENNGDHQFMLDQVNGMDSTNYTIVYYYLMNYHPSTDVIAIAVGNDVMPNYMCTDVLTTNSYGIKSQLVRDALAGRQNQITSVQMASINTAAQSQSQYESYLLELASLRTQINTLSTAKYNYFYNSDSVEVDMGEVINTLTDNENFYSNVSLMLYYFEIGNIAMADENFNLAMSAEEVSAFEIVNLEILYNVLLTVYEQLGGEFSLLDQHDIDILEKLSKNESKSGGISKSILISEFEFDFEPILLKATQNSSRMASSVTSNQIQIAQMKIMPNPASDFIGITISENYEFPLQLNIYDICGKLVMQKHIDNLNTIMLDKLTTGIYQAVITDANQKSFKQKLIIK